MMRGVSAKQMANPIYEDLVGVGHPFPLMHELEPGFDDERLDEPSDIGDVFVKPHAEAPSRLRACPSSSAAPRILRGSRCRHNIPLPRGPAPPYCRPSARPSARASAPQGEINPDAGLKLPARGQRNAESNAGRSHEIGDRQPLYGGEFPPDCAADSGRSEDEGQEQREPAAARPIRPSRCADPA